MWLSGEVRQYFRQRPQQVPRPWGEHLATVDGEALMQVEQRGVRKKGRR